VKYLPMFVLVFLLVLVACGAMPETTFSPVPEVYEHIPEPTHSPQEDEPVFVTEENPEDENKENETSIHAVLDGQARFTSAWAKTDTHFFFTPGTSTLYRVPLNNITQSEKVDLPGEGAIKIVGIDEPYIFVTRQTSNGTDWRQRYYNTYRISIITLQATLADSGMYVGVPFYHAASNSILFARADFDEGLAWLESLQLNTGTRNIFFEFESDHFHFDPAWWQMENNAVVFNGGWGIPVLILVDSELQACRIQGEDIGKTTPQEQPNGTQRELLQTEMNFTSLYNFNDLLFATVCTGYGDDAT